jgi:hypothetical protein
MGNIHLPCRAVYAADLLHATTNPDFAPQAFRRISGDDPMRKEPRQECITEIILRSYKPEARGVIAGVLKVCENIRNFLGFSRFYWTLMPPKKGPSHWGRDNKGRWRLEKWDLDMRPPWGSD